MGAFAFWVFEDRKHSGRIVLCFVGFFVAMVWILMIVNEVVAVLQVRPIRVPTCGSTIADMAGNAVQTIGHIFGLSDAILGLTVFAVGNSLGDLVANATVAVSADFHATVAVQESLLILSDSPAAHGFSGRLLV